MGLWQVHRKITEQDSFNQEKNPITNVFSTDLLSSKCFLQSLNLLSLKLLEQRANLQKVIGI